MIYLKSTILQVDPNDISELKLTNGFGTNANDTFISAAQEAFMTLPTMQ